MSEIAAGAPVAQASRFASENPLGRTRRSVLHPFAFSAACGKQRSLCGAVRVAGAASRATL